MKNGEKNDMLSDYAIEEYGGGFQIADYSEKIPTPYGVRYRGKSDTWKTQPTIDIDDVFLTKEDAVDVLAYDPTVDMPQYVLLLESVTISALK